MCISISLLCACLTLGAMDDSRSDSKQESQPAATSAVTPTTPREAVPQEAEHQSTSASAVTSKPVAKVQVAAPERDPTLISVPSNTIGAGEPLWVRREREQAQARIATAEASYAEARAALARVEAQRAASDDDDVYRGVVVYGPRRPGLYRALVNRPRPIALNRPAVNNTTAAAQAEEDQGAAAQRQFFEAGYPRIGPAIEGQLDAQRRFGEMSTPPLIQTQKARDEAVIRARKVPKAPE